MPFISIAQRYKCYKLYREALERGEIPEWDCVAWDIETKGGLSSLPYKKSSSPKKKKTSPKKKKSLSPKKISISSKKKKSTSPKKKKTSPKKKKSSSPKKFKIHHYISTDPIYSDYPQEYNDEFYSQENKSIFWDMK